MFIADPLLIEKARIALLSASGDAPCVVSATLERPYQPLKIALFQGEDGARLAAQARSARRFTVDDGAYRVIADLSDQVDRKDVLLIEAA